jgi:DNA-binding transcriptional ArsR family regulator
MLALTPAQQKIFDYLKQRSTPTDASTLAEYFMMSKPTAASALRHLLQEEEVELVKVGRKKFYKINDEYRNAIK